jgi:predicted PhzF superfamily epimerase YddE/YHI9
VGDTRDDVVDLWAVTLDVKTGSARTRLMPALHHDDGARRVTQVYGLLLGRYWRRGSLLRRRSRARSREDELQAGTYVKASAKDVQ